MAHEKRSKKPLKFNQLFGMKTQAHPNKMRNDKEERAML